MDGQWRRFAYSGVLALAFPVACAAGEDDVFSRAASAHDNVSPALLYAVALQESRRPLDGGLAAPWPWTLNSPARGPQYFPTRQKAEQALRELLSADPEANVDIGLLQISWRWHSDRVDNAAELLDPEVSARVGAAILSEALRSTDEVLLGLGRYHHWQNPWVSRRYGAEVLSLQRRLPGELFDDG
ncbi:hypothetical protein SAMN05660831_00024 [Thiohalospira halophila DSM 15071]|uniref:Transglycosylase SLT domain-containing protein n=1 Tax=Thiohalospira halophila DSM 15071 TaxID=1123397 RepID=A0A1I1N6B0_9GAMM|nr:hypothetical protein [Thiohalospira halophila]SFC90343.1 hypothetical protein SAMN05660831_00024 [Thiohalospira halophila DSM 15071]